MLTFEAREVMRDNAHNLVGVLLEEGIPFRLVLWTNDEWDMPLPDETHEAYPLQMMLEIADMALEESKIDEMTGDIVLNAYFVDREYSKILVPEEIIAVLDLEGQPYILNNFSPEIQKVYKFDDEENELTTPKTKENMTKLITLEGIPQEAADKSISAFMKNNPGLFKK